MKFYPHGRNIAPVAQAARLLLRTKNENGVQAKLTKSERTMLAELIQKIERTSIQDGVDFSRCQMAELFDARNRGVPIEFEMIGPYMADYASANYKMTTENLISEDAIGLQLAAVFRDIFPSARLVSLCDDYNTGKFSVHAKTDIATYGAATKRHFKQSLVRLFKFYNAIGQDAVHGQHYLLISEDNMQLNAELLVARLEGQGYIQRTGDEITFINEDAENPLYAQVRLRTKSGRWLCEALDAASYIDPANRNITHLVVLPSYMKTQQDRVWEILRVLGIPSNRFHNIFFDPNASVLQVCAVVRQVFQR